MDKRISVKLILELKADGLTLLESVEKGHYGSIEKGQKLVH